MHVVAPDGSRLYTLYTSEEGEKRYSFVHVLDLDEEWAHCVDLPLDLGDTPEAMAIGISPNGWSVYVADGAAGKLAEVSTARLTVTRVVVHEPVRHTRLGGHVGDAGRVVAVAGEHAHCRFEDLPLPFGASD